MFSFLKKWSKVDKAASHIGNNSPVDSNEAIEQLADMLVQDDILCEMYMFSDLKCDQLDYSVDSLKWIDLDLDAVRTTPPQGEDMLRLVLRVGAYVGEVIRRNSAQKMNWLDFDEAAKLNSMVEKLGRQPGTLAVLWTAPTGITFPLGKVQKFLMNGPEDSTHFFASTMLNKE